MSEMSFNYRYFDARNVESKIELTRVEICSSRTFNWKKINFRKVKKYLINLSSVWKYRKRNVLFVSDGIGSLLFISCNIIAFNIFLFHSVINCFLFSLFPSRARIFTIVDCHAIPHHKITFCNIVFLAGEGIWCSEKRIVLLHIEMVRAFNTAIDIFWRKWFSVKGVELSLRRLESCGFHWDASISHKYLLLLQLVNTL